MTLCLTAAAAPRTVDAQNPNLKRIQQQQQAMQQQMQRRMDQAMRTATENSASLPSDPELLSLHKEFINKAERLAVEYERKKQYDKAREVFEAMHRLVPSYTAAEEGLKRMLQVQSMQDKTMAKVDAKGGWQDSGATLQQGMPVQVEVRGTWKVVLETGPEGVEIPEKMRPRDSRIKLGTLIGAIATSPAELDDAKQFVVRSDGDFVAEKTGRLFLRMFDIDPSDNDGEMLVLIKSTFAK